MRDKLSSLVPHFSSTTSLRLTSPASLPITASCCLLSFPDHHDSTPVGGRQGLHCWRCHSEGGAVCQLTGNHWCNRKKERKKRESPSSLYLYSPHWLSPSLSPLTHASSIIHVGLSFLSFLLLLKSFQFAWNKKCGFVACSQCLRSLESAEALAT